MTAKCLGCGHAQSNHINSVGLCLVTSCRLCLIFQDDSPQVCECGYAIHGTAKERRLYAEMHRQANEYRKQRDQA